MSHFPLKCRKMRCIVIFFLFLLLESYAAVPSPQEPHYKDGQHNENFVHSEEEAKEEGWQSMRQLSDQMWKGEIVMQKEGHSLIWHDSSSSKSFEEIAPGVAFFLTFANVAIVETSEGLVMIDTGTFAMLFMHLYRVLREGSFLLTDSVYHQIRKWKSAPLHTAIYTHGHYDHVFGVGLFDEEAKKNNWTLPRVIAQEQVLPRFQRYIRTNGYNSRINSRQFQGEESSLFDLPTDFRYPDITFRDNFTFTLGGEDFHLFHARGETDDATWVWIPKKSVLCSGDLFIWSAPNAGNPQKVQRYAAEWADALRVMASFEPEILIPGHGPPIFGKDRIKVTLNSAAEYLQSLVEQTIELMNKGHRLDYIIRNVKVPQHLQNVPYLLPSYDEPQFIIRNIWRLYGGWFDLNPSHLKPPSDEELSKELCALSGGCRTLATRALQLAQEKNFELACSLIEFAAQAAPDDVIIAQHYVTIYSNRAKDSSTTSLMAKGIFNAAAREKEAFIKSMNIPDDGILSRMLGWLVGNKPLSKVSVKDLNYTALDSDAPRNTQHSYNNVVATAFQQMKEFVESDEWEKIGEADGVVTYRMERDGFPVFKGEGDIPFAPRAVMALALDHSHRTKWDPRIELESIIESIDSHTSVMYRKVPGKLMVAGRDMVFVAAWKREGMAYTTVLKSIEHVNAPMDKEYVRMDILLGGMFVAPKDNDPNTSHVTYIMWSDLKGGIPSALLTQIGAMQTRSIARMRDILIP